MDDCPLLECFLDHPEPTDIVFLLDSTLLRQQQFDDFMLQQVHLDHPEKYPFPDFSDMQLICCTPNPMDSWKISIPTQELDNIIQWYHLVLNHVDMTRLHLTIISIICNYAVLLII